VRGHLLDQLFCAHRIAGIKHHGTRNRAQDGQVLEAHLGGAIFADAHPGMRARQFEVRPRDAGDANLVARARQKCREGRSERNFAPCRETGGNAHHVLFRDETLGKAVGELPGELFRKRRVFGVAVQRHDPRVNAADAHERVAVGLAGGYFQALRISGGRIGGGGGIPRRRQRAGRGDGLSGGRARAGLQFGNRPDGFLLG